MKSIWRIVLEKEVLQIMAAIFVCSMLAMTLIGIFDPLRWNETEQSAYYARSGTWLELAHILWPSALISIAVGVIRVTRAALRERDNFIPLHPKQRKWR